MQVASEGDVDGRAPCSMKLMGVNVEDTNSFKKLVPAFDSSANAKDSTSESTVPEPRVISECFRSGGSPSPSGW